MARPKIKSVRVGNYAQDVDMTGEAGDILRSVQNPPSFKDVKGGVNSSAKKPKKKIRLPFLRED